MKSVLIVEDDADINKALQIRLMAAGYKILSATDAYTGFCLASQNRPDMMVLDISMPAGGGLSIVERLKESSEGDEIPFIVLTASKRVEYRERAADLGALAYFEKPYEAAALLHTINEAISGRWNIEV